VRDAPIDGLIRKSLSAGVRRTPDHYVSENLMAAYLEASLSPQEMSAFEAHVSECATCQEILAVYVKLQPHEDDGLPNEALPEKKTLFRFSIPIPVVGALLVCAVIAAVFFRFQHKPKEDAGNQVAELRAPEPQPAAQPMDRMSQNAPKPAPFPPELRMGLESGSARKEAAVLEKKGKAGGSVDSPVARFDKLSESIPSAVSPPVPVPVSASVAVGALSAAPGILESEQKKERGSIAPAMTNERNAVSVTSERKATAVTEAGLPAAQLGKPTETAPFEASAVAPSTPSAPSKAGTLSAADSSLVSKQNKDGGAVVPAAADERDAIASIRTQQPVSRPHIYAAQNRIAGSLYTTSSVESTLRFAIKNLGSNVKSAEAKTIADRVYYKNMGYWIDKQCTEHTNSEIVELASEAPEYTAILAKYPDLKAIFPVIVYWEGKTCVLR
jgi:hypothetical protein